MLVIGIFSLLTSVAADFVVRRGQPVRPPEYKTTACRDGGPLDLEPARTGWP